MLYLYNMDLNPALRPIKSLAKAAEVKAGAYAEKVKAFAESLRK